MLIEGRAHELLREGPKAVESYRTLSQLFPDRVDYGLLLLRAQLSGGQQEDATATLANLRKLPATEVEEARLDLSEANVGGLAGDFKRDRCSRRRRWQAEKPSARNYWKRKRC